MAGGRKSYFEEKRSQYSDPNFFNKLTNIDDIANNVRRIIRDVRFGLINDTDYMYFKNPNVINTCLQTAQKNFNEAFVICNALGFYINVGLNSGYTPAGVDRIAENVNASNAQIKYNNKAYVWKNLVDMFTMIQRGGDPKSCLKYIETIDRRFINDL